jgi:hypothetical protein
VGRHAIALQKWANEFRERVTGDPLSEIGIEPFIKVLDLVPQVSVLQRVIVGDIERSPELLGASLVALPHRSEAPRQGKRPAG